MSDSPPGNDDLSSLTPEQVLAKLMPQLAGLLALLRRDLRDVMLAEDMLHDAVVTAIEKIRSGELQDVERLPGFVYRVALNHWRNSRRKMQMTVAEPAGMTYIVDDSPQGAPVESLQRAQWARHVRAVLKELPSARDRELIVRYYLDQEDKDTVCQALGVTPIHFNRIAFRARERLKELLAIRGLELRDLAWAGLLVGWATLAWRLAEIIR